MRKAVVNTSTGVVENVIEVKDDSFTLENKTLVNADDTTQINGTWDGSKFNPAPIVPAPIDYDKQFRDAITAATTIADLKAALLGNTGPGAQPKTGKPE